MAPASDSTDKIAFVKPTLLHLGTTARDRPDVALDEEGHGAAASGGRLHEPHGGDVGKTACEEGSYQSQGARHAARKKQFVVDEKDILGVYLPMIQRVGDPRELYLPKLLVLTAFGNIKPNGPQFQLPVEVVLRLKPEPEGFQLVIQRGTLNYEEVDGEERYRISGVSTTAMGNFRWMAGVVLSNFKPGSVRRIHIYCKQVKPVHEQRIDDVRVSLSDKSVVSASRLRIINVQEFAGSKLAGAGSNPALPADMVGQPNVQQEGLKSHQEQQQLNGAVLAGSESGRQPHQQDKGLLVQKSTDPQPTSRGVEASVVAAARSDHEQKQVELLQRELGEMLFAGHDMITFMSEVSYGLLQLGFLNEDAAVCMHELILSARKDSNSRLLDGLSSRLKLICISLHGQQMRVALHHTDMLVDEVLKYAQS